MPRTRVLNLAITLRQKFAKNAKKNATAHTKRPLMRPRLPNE